VSWQERAEILDDENERWQIWVQNARMSMTLMEVRIESLEKENTELKAEIALALNTS